MDKSPDTGDAVADGLDHAWAWFALHAGQRMQLINYFIVAVAFVTAAYAASVSAGRNWVAGAISAGGIILCVAFELLDVRTRQLVRLGEQALISLESCLAERANTPELNLVARAGARARGTSYRFVLRMLTRAGILLFICGAVVAIIRGM
jgi:hypothetical protein